MSKYERTANLISYQICEDRLKQCCSEIQSVIKGLYYRDITILVVYR